MKEEIILTVGEHNHYNLRLLVSKNNMKKLGIKAGDSVKFTKVGDGKFIVEKVEE